MLNFIAKSTAGKSQLGDADVRISTSAEKYYNITINAESAKIIGNGEVPTALMVAEANNCLYFVPTTMVSRVGFSLCKTNTEGRLQLRIAKSLINLDKYQGEYNFHFDEKEQAYCIDRKFLLR